MSDGLTLEALAQRVAALEERLDQEAGLRASQDRDLATIGQRVQATNLVVQALHITQSEHTRTLAEHTQTLAEHTRMLTDLGAGQAAIVTMLQTLIDRTEGGTDDR